MNSTPFNPSTTPRVAPYAIFETQIDSDSETHDHNEHSIGLAGELCVLQSYELTCATTRYFVN